MAQDENIMTVEERIIIASGSSNLRDICDPLRYGVTDGLKANAWSKSHLGRYLMLLHGEYDRLAKPIPISQEVVLKMTLNYQKEDDKKSLKDCELLAKIEASKWHAQEMAVFFGRLKMLPIVLEQVVLQCQAVRISQAQAVARYVVMRWLEKTCKVCGGTQKKKIENTPSNSAINCNACAGAGETKIGYGNAGQNMYQYLVDCKNAHTAGCQRRLKVNHGTAI